MSGIHFIRGLLELHGLHANLLGSSIEGPIIQHYDDERMTSTEQVANLTAASVKAGFGQDNAPGCRGNGL